MSWGLLALDTLGARLCVRRQVHAVAATPAVLVVACATGAVHGRGRISVFSTETGQPLVGSLGHADPSAASAVSARCLALSSSSSPAMIAAGGRDGAVRLFDLRANQCVQTLRGHRGTPFPPTRARYYTCAAYLEALSRDARNAHAPTLSLRLPLTLCLSTANM
jgi:WD40 repeat protein